MHTSNIITIQGQTASGKSEMAVQLALHLKDAWVISCDSRQIYKQLNLGTGKIEGIWKTQLFQGNPLYTFWYKDTPHFLIDEFDPNQPQTLVNIISRFNEICSLPNQPKYLILCGGTGLYIKAIIEQYQLPILTKIEAEKVEIYKHSLSSITLSNLQQAIHEQIPDLDLNNSEYHNPQRIINHLTNNYITVENLGTKISAPRFQSYHQFAILIDQEILKENIHKRIIDRINKGMIHEIQGLQYLGNQKLFELGLEYRYTTQFIQNLLTKSEYIDILTLKSIHYSKRQLTWLKQQPVLWISTLSEMLPFLAN